MADVNPANGVVDGKDANDTVAVYRLYYNGGWFSTGVTGTAPVRSKKANALGLYDMSGNVWEWCFDLAASSRVLRGGSWYNSANAIVVSFSRSDPPETESSATGFRIALQ
jgi:formylglycine-generating enzyme required for sulfatase activity